jgi:OPT family oligopeptide transporter
MSTNCSLQVNVNLLAQVIPGALIPGNPLANMIFKAYSIQTLAEAMSFTQDLKLGHYVKVPPRATFLVQMIATTLAAFVQVGVKTWLFTNVPRMCEEDNAAHLTCPHNRVFFTSSAVFGLIGPSRQFGPKSMYHPEVYALIVGALLPIPFWLWTRKRPNSIVQWLNIPVLLTGVMFIPPATGINYSSWFVVGFIFQFVIRRRNFTWWSKFNYITSAALDSGTSLLLLIRTWRRRRDLLTTMCICVCRNGCSGYLHLLHIAAAQQGWEDGPQLVGQSG